MNTRRPLLACLLPALLLGMLLSSGCDDSHVRAGVVVTDDACCYDEPGLVRYDYRLEVLVTDEWGYAVPGVAVELIVSDTPEIHAIGTTGARGRALFDVAARPDSVAHIVIADPVYGEEWTTVLLEPDTYEVYVEFLL